MTHPALILNPEGTLLIDAPEKCDQCGGTGLAGPSFEEQSQCTHCGGVTYDQALQQAIKEGVCLINPEDSTKIMEEIGCKGKCESSIGCHSIYDCVSIKDNKPYPLPEGWDYVIEETCKWHGHKNNCGNETCWDLQECQKSPLIKTAKLVKKEPAKQSASDGN